MENTMERLATSRAEELHRLYRMKSREIEENCVLIHSQRRSLVMFLIFLAVELSLVRITYFIWKGDLMEVPMAVALILIFSIYGYRLSRLNITRRRKRLSRDLARIEKVLEELDPFAALAHAGQDLSEEGDLAGANREVVLERAGSLLSELA